MLVVYKGRTIEIELTNVSYDHHEWCDVYVESGYYEISDTGRPRDLTDEELEEMSQSDSMYEWIQAWLY